MFVGNNLWSRWRQEILIQSNVHRDIQRIKNIYGQLDLLPSHLDLLLQLLSYYCECSSAAAGGRVSHFLCCISRLLRALTSLPGCPRLRFSIVEVTDSGAIKQKRNS